jgi:colanic acid/amylovoran biosynthesis glycosyltransferase
MDDRKLPLAYLVSRYPAVSHTFILREVQRLRALGHRIETASVNPPDRSSAQMDEAERHEAAATYCLKQDGIPGAARALAWCLLSSPVRLLRGLRLGWSLGRGPRGLAYAVEAVMIARWMQLQGLGHLHVHFGNAGASVGLLVKALIDCHLSCTIHGPDEFDDVPGQQLRWKLEAADAVVCISQFARSQLMRIGSPAHWDKLSLCRLGVDLSQFRYADPLPAAGRRLRLLCVGRLTPAKGQVLLVQACARLLRYGIDFELELVGDGPDRERIEAAIAAAGLQQRILLLGALTQQGVRKAMSAADLFVLPSLAEGIPVVLMEAMSSGLPCVSTPVNGIPELIAHGRNGLLAIPGDVDSLADCLRQLASDDALRLRLARAARAEVESRYDIERNTRALSALFCAFPQAPAAALAAA